MAIYHLEVKILKKEKAYNYFKRNFKTKEALYQKDYIFQNIDNLKFWEIACENEQINGRIFRAVELSLPYELSLDENIKLVNEFVETLLKKRHYYSLIIKVSKNNLKNIFALIVFSERIIDDIDRPLEQFFHYYNRHNPHKGGARKDPKWREKSTLYETRQLWEEILNKYLKINNFNEI